MRVGPPLLFVATAGGVALTTRSVLGHPVALPIALAYLGSYLGLVACGSLVPGLEMWGPVITRLPAAGGVALTFDDGPHPEHTRAIARILAKYGAKATFFAIGEKVERHPDVVRELHAAGHEIGIHGHRVDRWLGFRRLAAVRDDLEAAVRVVERTTGARPALFRPPYGVTNPRIARAAEELDLDVVGWSVRAFDGVASTSARAIERRVVPRLRGGAIVCLHDAPEVGERTPAAIAALPAVLAALHERGLRCRTVSALIEAESEAPPAPW